MPVPWEALIPFGLLVGLFGVAGTGLNIVKRSQNDWKPPRYSLDRWEEMMMERDRRLTGTLRGQRTDPIAPKEFATNSVWDSTRLNA
ncbi:hypothetical protein BD324DRAFT_683036 [Kockovaella imperatae]|uniref:NADH dehydrogenase [ubiquinone] 1 alpha subcomplex subunit 1 n=1 Tax=Kockovaella imperatae TaxID=4999 RepID=A0A1Y1UAR8_9TREE|nr:hypothetical protein BD324DRAFT_683036 [Kockovaella imperatae]ORX35133.1 hypothetical protein BD324DRAFT_683036 [Kockovaella imperatae]